MHLVSDCLPFCFCHPSDPQTLLHCSAFLLLYSSSVLACVCSQNTHNAGHSISVHGSLVLHANRALTQLHHISLWWSMCSRSNFNDKLFWFAEYLRTFPHPPSRYPCFTPCFLLGVSLLSELREKFESEFQFGNQVSFCILYFSTSVFVVLSIWVLTILHLRREVQN